MLKTFYLAVGGFLVLWLAFANYHGMTIWQAVSAVRSPTAKASHSGRRTWGYGGYHHK